jgi:hypothetical protein
VEAHQQSFEEWRRTHPPIAGGSPEADAPAAEGGENGDQPTTDPWEGAVASAPEEHRDLLQEALNPLREQIGPRLEVADRLEPLNDFADDLLALAQDGDESGNALQDVLGFVALTAAIGDPENPDPQALEEFAGWWEQIGETYGLFDEDDGDPGDGGGGEDDPAQAKITELEGQIQALRQELGGLAQNDRVAAEKTIIQSTLEKGLKKNGITFEDEEQAEETRKYILRLAQAYAEDVQDTAEMVNLGLKDYLKLTGGAQRELLGDRETETVAAGRSPGNGTPDTRPEDITTGDPTRTRQNAKRAALSRLTG